MIRFFSDLKCISKKARIESYDFLEKFLLQSHSDWRVPPSTEIIISKLLLELKKLTNEQLAFLICHSGYIPEIYNPDSSPETLYTKMIEAVVMEWAIRLGFSKSVLPTQKSSKEDVTIKDDVYVIVCDAKSFRLGRSQAAPNVKDMLKHADIQKWLSAYPDFKKIGGLVTFPSQHDWKKGSDFYQYTTDFTSPTLCLNYEHMAYMLLKGFDKNILIKTLTNYRAIFPRKLGKMDNNRDIYYQQIETFIFGNKYNEWKEFKIVANEIISEFVYHSHISLNNYLLKIKTEVENKYQNQEDINELRKIAINAEYNSITQELHKQMERITRFRTIAKDYNEKYK
ncbi:hypothetical protein APT61_19805 [Leclercia adecarboxylata]|uniref:HindIII family type II restriction endonuclease n=1 Tax=Leclercia adecarboxylata TaxID=83655 RepID=UPI000744CE2E|nr:HindIII family type II restriction endonuclease [Leclercia adecarboxylata]ALZ98137.1 hypothetical protein APT61_19805 [Leclercia adecarboxylata]